MHAVVTAGGTSEPIDDVRVITNLSTGRFGAALANALVARGVRTTLLAARALMSQPSWVDPRVERVGFRTFADLDAALQEHTRTPPDLLLMAAAVSDYSPIPTEGKIRSDAEEIVIRMRRNPKLLGALRTRCGPHTFLVGFKLLSGVSRDGLVEVARAQVLKCALDATVANDLQAFGPDLHPVVLVEAGRTTDHAGSKAESAAFVVDRVLAAQAERSTMVRAASVTLVHPPTGQVLVGVRGTSAAEGLTSVPGGRVEPGESLLAAARRELLEETGLRAEALPWAQVEVVVPGEPGFRVASFVIPTEKPRSPRHTPELSTRWIPLAEALARDDLAPGTHTALTRAASLLAARADAR